MKGKVVVIVPRPKVKEWESPVAPQLNNQNNPIIAPSIIKKVKETSSTSIEAVKERSLTQKLNQVLASDEHLGAKSLSRSELEATFNNYTPLLVDSIKEESKEAKPITEEEKMKEEAEERDFLEQQRTSSLSSRAKSRSNKHTPESNKSKDTPDYNISSKCFNKLNFSKFDKTEWEQNKISEEESADETQYSQSGESLSSYKPINIQSPF